MSSRLCRLKMRSEYLTVARRGKHWATPGLVLQVDRQSNPATPAAIRVGFTASKKVGNAVQRNRAKRRLRAVAAEILTEKGHSGHDYVLIGRRGTLDRPYTALNADLEKALKRVHQSNKGR